MKQMKEEACEFSTLKWDDEDEEEKACDILDKMGISVQLCSACELEGNWCIAPTDEDDGECDGSCTDLIGHEGSYIRVEREHYNVLKALWDEAHPDGLQRK